MSHHSFLTIDYHYQLSTINYHYQLSTINLFYPDWFGNSFPLA